MPACGSVPWSRQVRPQLVVERLNDAIHQAMKDPEVVKRFADQGMQAFPSTPAQFGSFMQSE
jgi:tripartite-type tricarboxylate transporter receptor subunit TctC